MEEKKKFRSNQLQKKLSREKVEAVHFRCNQYIYGI